MKKGLFLILCLFAFATPGHAGVLLEQQLAGCEKIGLPQWRDDCYESIPAKGQTYALCLKFSSLDRKKECFKNNPPHTEGDCLLNRLPELLDACLLQLKETTNDISLCAKINNRGSRRNCYTCSDANGSKNACLQYWAGQIQDKTICALIDQKTSKNACLATFSTAKVKPQKALKVEKVKITEKPKEVKAAPAKAIKPQAAKSVKPAKSSSPKKLTNSEIKQAKQLSEQIKAEKLAEQRRAAAVVQEKSAEAIAQVMVAPPAADAAPTRLKGIQETKAQEKAAKAQRVQEARAGKALEKAQKAQAEKDAKAAKVQEKADRIQSIKDVKAEEKAAKEQKIQEARDAKLREKDAKAQEKADRIQSLKDAKAEENAAKEQKVEEAHKAKLQEKAEKEQAIKDAKEAKAQEKAERIQKAQEARQSKAQGKVDAQEAQSQQKQDEIEARAKARLEKEQQEKEAREARMQQRNRDLEQARAALVMTPKEDLTDNATAEAVVEEAVVEKPVEMVKEKPAPVAEKMVRIPPASENMSLAPPPVTLQSTGFGCVTGFGGWSEPPQKKKDEITCDRNNVEQFESLLNSCTTWDTKGNTIKLFDTNKDGCVTCDDLRIWKKEVQKLYKAKKRATEGNALDLKQCRDRKF